MAASSVTIVFDCTDQSSFARKYTTKLTDKKEAASPIFDARDVQRQSVPTRATFNQMK